MPRPTTGATSERFALGAGCGLAANDEGLWDELGAATAIRSDDGLVFHASLEMAAGYLGRLRSVGFTQILKMIVYHFVGVSPKSPEHNLKVFYSNQDDPRRKCSCRRGRWGENGTFTRLK